jgi:hypothetical protein
MPMTPSPIARLTILASLAAGALTDWPLSARGGAACPSARPDPADLPVRHYTLLRASSASTWPAKTSWPISR